jgi:hypothetical protein
MKVLKKGREQKGWSTETTCTGSGNGGGGCGALLLVSQGDLYHTYSSHYDGSNETYTTFRCPECKVQTDLPDNKVPSSIQVRDGEKRKRRKGSHESTPQGQ